MNLHPNRQGGSRPVIGIPWLKLTDRAPRGVVRAARAMAERLACNPSFQLLAISEPVFDRNEILFETMELSEWLDSHSLEAPGEPRVSRRFPAGAAQRSITLLKQAVTLAGLKRPAQQALQLSSRLRRRVRDAMVSPAPPSVERAICGATPRQPRCRSLREFDAIISFECYDSLWNWPVELHACRMIGVFHDAIPLRINEGQYWNPGAYYRAVGAMVNRAAAIACDSQSSQRDLHSFFPNSRHKTQVVHLGHDRERFLPRNPLDSGASILAARRQSPGKRIAMIGEIEPRKNQAGVLRACQRLKAVRPEERVTLALIGKQQPGNPYEFLEQQAREHVNIEHLGYVPDAEIGDVLRSCDAFLYPSLWEGFGIPVLEAMSAGVPVVCSDNSSLPEVGGAFAFYCDPYDPASIVAAIHKALEMPPGRREPWVRAAREHAAAFTWSAAAEKLTELIHQALGAPPAPLAAPQESLPPRRFAECLCENSS